VHRRQRRCDAPSCFAGAATVCHRWPRQAGFLAALLALTVLIPVSLFPIAPVTARDFAATSAAIPSEPPPGFALAPWGGGPLPPFTLDDHLTGKVRRPIALKGDVVLVHFFATWCEPCVPELASLQRLAHATRGAPLRIVAIDVGEVDLRVRAFFEKHPVAFPVLLDRDRAVARAWGVTALPTSFVLDATLQPRLFVEGDLDWSRPEVVSAIAALYPKQSRNDAPAGLEPPPRTTGGHNGPP
jgi:thiol-disulfide isomerase/thioredoxin